MRRPACGCGAPRRNRFDAAASPLFAARQASFRVWAPQASDVALEVLPSALACDWTAEPTPDEKSGLPAPAAPPGGASLPTDISSHLAVVVACAVLTRALPLLQP